LDCNVWTIFDDAAIEFLNKLSEEVKERIYDKIISTKENPLHFFDRLTGRTDYKLRMEIIELSLILTKGMEQLKLLSSGIERIFTKINTFFQQSLCCGMSYPVI